ncbi:MAG: 2-C-methyl-D-erythritol 4-phosphate cytidylyltransferase [Cyclobacteriaceae bacterium]
MQRYAVLVAGGKGTRMESNLPKQYIKVNGKPILVHTIEKFLKADREIKLVLVLPTDSIDYWETIKAEFCRDIDIVVVSGGLSRFQSVKNGLDSIGENEAIVAIHDAVRPCIPTEIILESFVKAETEGSAVVAVSLKESLRKISHGNSVACDRNQYKLIQTPQTFDIKLLRNAFEQTESVKFTDDATVVESAGYTITLIDGSYENIKVTTPEDLRVASIYLK